MDLDLVRAHVQSSIADERVRARATTWLEMLVLWNTRMDLTAARSEAELVDLMLADAIELAPRIPAGARVVDVGTGAGAPGLAIAILRDDVKVTMCEPLAKRVAFLQAVLAAIDVKPELVKSKGGGLVPKSYDVAISRATLAPPEWLTLGSKLVVPGGSVWVLLAKAEPPSIKAATLAEDFSYVWPKTGMNRRAVRYVTRR